MSDLLIRDSRDDDLPEIQAVYAHHVLHGTGTFELERSRTCARAAPTC